MPNVSDRVRSLRNLRGWTKSKLAAKAGISQGYLSDLENGNVTAPRSDVVSKIADALGTTTDYLLDRTDDPSPTRPGDKGDIIRRDFPYPSKHRERWESMTPEQREEALRQIEAFEEFVLDRLEKSDE